MEYGFYYLENFIIENHNYGLFDTKLSYNLITNSILHEKGILLLYCHNI